MSTVKEFAQLLDASAEGPDGTVRWRWAEDIRLLYATIRSNLAWLEFSGRMCEVSSLVRDAAGTYRAALLFRAKGGVVEFSALSLPRYVLEKQDAVWLRCPGAPDFHLIPQYATDRSVECWYIKKAGVDRGHSQRFEGLEDEEAVPLTQESLLAALTQLLRL